MSVRAITPLTTTPITTDPSDMTDQKSNDRETKRQSKNKSNDKNTATTKSGNPHQCITRSDGVVRALRARTGDQHPAASMIISQIVSGGF